MTDRVFNSYDPAGSFPQPARFGRGNVDKDGNHTPPGAFASHEVTGDLPHGIDEDFYTTTAADTLTPKDQSAVDAIIQQRIDNRSRLAARQPDQIAALKNPNLVDAIKAGKTKALADAWVAAESSPADALAHLLMILSRVARYVAHSEDEFYDSGE